MAVIKTERKKRRPPPPPPPEPAAPPPPEPPPPEPQKRRGIERGNPLGASSSATAGAEDPDFTYGYYLDNMIAILSQNWVRPRLAKRIDVARIYFRIHRDGSISDLQLVQSSGSEIFDQAALRAVEASAPLPRLPSGYKKDYLGINLVVE
ncbi:MAG: TonB C-terminal domain-containing protein [Acidobacteria bacterium]|nr:MAG: TonB C-terminal domain-containing protein [Acidobacteriota bacterium]